MSSYTQINLNEVENQAPNFGMPEEMEARFASGDLGLEHSGSARLRLDDEVLELSEYDAVRVGPGVMRNFEAGPDGVDYVAFGAPLVEDKQAEADMQPGWWQD